MIETEDERRARLLAAGLNPNTLQDGESFKVSLMFADSAPRSSTTFKDAAMTMTFNDAMPQIDSEFRYKIRYCIGRMNDASPFIAQQGINDAQGLIGRMAMARGDYGGAGAGMVTDAGKTALITCSEYLTGAIAATKQRLAGTR